MPKSRKTDRTPVSMKNSVFISYRRLPSQMLARAIFQDLKAHGIDAFMDVEGLDGGRFDEIIASQIAARPYFLLILTPRTLEGCTTPGDWLLREIEQAFSLGRRIVPVATPEFDRKEIDQHLSGRTAEELSRLNTVSLVNEYWEASMEKLRTRFLKPINLPTVATPREAQEAVRRKLQQASAAPPVTDEQMRQQKNVEQKLMNSSFEELIQEEIRELIKKDEIGQALDRLYTFLDEQGEQVVKDLGEDKRDLLNELDSHTAKLSRIEKTLRKREISEEDARIEKNKIIVAIQTIAQVFVE